MNDKDKAEVRYSIQTSGGNNMVVSGTSLDESIIHILKHGQAASLEDIQVRVIRVTVTEAKPITKEWTCRATLQ